MSGDKYSATVGPTVGGTRQNMLRNSDDISQKGYSTDGSTTGRSKKNSGLAVLSDRLYLSSGMAIKVTDDEMIQRNTGTILQIKNSIYLVLNGSIWNKLGVRMESPIDSGYYKQIGHIIQGYAHPDNWYDEEMLELRR